MLFSGVGGLAGGTAASSREGGRWLCIHSAARGEKGHGFCHSTCYLLLVAAVSIRAKGGVCPRARRDGVGGRYWADSGGC